MMLPADAYTPVNCRVVLLRSEKAPMKKVRTDWSLDERLRSLVEKLIESETGLQITKKDGACIYFEFCGEEMGIEASYLDYMAEKEALYCLHEEAEGDSKKFIEAYRKWKADWREHFITEGYDYVPSRFEDVAKRTLNS